MEAADAAMLEKLEKESPYHVLKEAIHLCKDPQKLKELIE
jgi:hypothetical protein